MRAAVLTGVGSVAVEERPDPVARPGWVGVRVDVASWCGTDTHQYEGRIDSPFPRVPGHDFAGTVESTGDGVDPALADRRFAAKPSLPCGECPPVPAGGPSAEAFEVASTKRDGAIKVLVDFRAAGSR